MGYYVRAFYKSSDVSSINEVLKWMCSRGYDMFIDDRDVEAEDWDSTGWDHVSLKYKEEKLPILVECNRDDGSEQCMLRQEIDEFLEFIGKPGFSLAKRKVIKHLEDTKFVICCQWLTSDIDDDGCDASNEFLRYFVEHCEGMTQFDGEGFYENRRLILKCR